MTRFVAEIGSNHNRDAERAEALIDECAAAGAWGVKVQVWRIEDLFAPEARAARPELDARREWELPPELLPRLARAARDKGLAFGATPFSLEAVEAVRGDVDFLKVASYELLWHELIEACAGTGLPLILSTGIATIEEVDGAVEAARSGGCRDLTLLQCVSAYPTPRDQCNLACIGTLRDRYDVPAGWSDHSSDEDVVVRAAGRWDSDLIEVHVDLADASGNEAGEHNWNPDDLARMIRAAGMAGPDDGAADADGDGIKRAMPAEEFERGWRADPADGLRPLRSVRATLAASR